MRKSDELYPVVDRLSTMICIAKNAHMVHRPVMDDGELLPLDMGEVEINAVVRVLEDTLEDILERQWLEFFKPASFLGVEIYKVCNG